MPVKVSEKMAAKHPSVAAQEMWEAGENWPNDLPEEIRPSFARIQEQAKKEKKKPKHTRRTRLRRKTKRARPTRKTRRAKPRRRAKRARPRPKRRKRNTKKNNRKGET